MIEIPWDGPSVIVPAEAIEVLHKFNHNYNYVPLVYCPDCDAEDQGTCWGRHEAWGADPKGFCWEAMPRKACQKADKETAARADAPIFKDTAHAARKQTMALGA